MIKLTRREIDLIIIGILLNFALILSLCLVVSVLGQVYEDGSFIIKGCIPFMICQ